MLRLDATPDIIAVFLHILRDGSVKLDPLNKAMVRAFQLGFLHTELLAGEPQLTCVLPSPLHARYAFLLPAACTLSCLQSKPFVPLNLSSMSENVTANTITALSSTVTAVQTLNRFPLKTTRKFVNYAWWWFGIFREKCCAWQVTVSALVLQGEFGLQRPVSRMSFTDASGTCLDQV